MTAFDKIAAGLADAIAYAEGDKSKGRVAAGAKVKAIRAKTKLSQTVTRRIDIKNYFVWLLGSFLRTKPRMKNKHRLIGQIDERCSAI